MGIIRGGDAEYENTPLEEIAPRIEETIRQAVHDTTLNLSGKFFSAAETAILARFEPVKTIKSLDLSDNRIGDPELKMLCESPFLQNLEELHLGVNFISDGGVAELTKSCLKNLRVLSFNDNRLTDTAIAGLVKSPNLGNIETLILGWNQIGNETAKALG